MQKEIKLKKHSLVESELKPVGGELKSNSFLKWEYIVAGVGLVIAAAALYYQKKSYDGQVKTLPPPIVQVSSVNKQATFSDF